MQRRKGQFVGRANLEGESPSPGCDPASQGSGQDFLSRESKLSYLWSLDPLFLSLCYWTGKGWPLFPHIILVTGVRIVALVKRWHRQCVVVQLVQGLCAMLVDWCGQTRYNLILNMLDCYFFFLSDRYDACFFFFFLNVLNNPFLCLSCFSKHGNISMEVELHCVVANWNNHVLTTTS